MSLKPLIVVFTGSGISAESGIKTFRDQNGLWENFKIEDVASPEAWKKHPEKVRAFYNARFFQLSEVQPNAAHHAIAALELQFRVQVITQNVDNLHERAGSTSVLHLHGELTKARSELYQDIIVPMPNQGLQSDSRCEKGSLLRPHIVWFGETVPFMSTAQNYMAHADICIVIGTSLQVYPAAGLLNHLKPQIPVWVIDPHLPQSNLPMGYQWIQSKAAEGMGKLREQLLSDAYIHIK